MSRCPKCRRHYSRNGKFQKTQHHIIPRRLFRDRDLPPGARELLMGFTIDICRSCHDEINQLIEEAEREVLYNEHQAMYEKILTRFLEPARFAPPALSLVDRVRAAGM